MRASCPAGTAYISDIGMTGPRDSIIGFSLETVLPRFTRPPAHPLPRGGGPGLLNAVVDRRPSPPTGRAQRDRAGAAPGRGVEARGRCRPDRPRAASRSRRRWSASSGRPPRARPIWPWPWRTGCRSRSWSPTRARCTAAWTSAPPSPIAAARAAVPHHLLDLADPDEAFTVADWVDAGARGWSRDLRPAAGCRWSSAARACTSAPWSMATTTPPALVTASCAARLADELEADGLEPLAARLATADPAAAARIDLRNPRRVLRALERAEAGGGASSRRRAIRSRAASRCSALSRPREVLYRRIDERARPAVRQRPAGRGRGAARRAATVRSCGR